MTRRKRTPAICNFCGEGGKPMSKEHIWSDWISQRLLTKAEREQMVTYTIRTPEGVMRRYRKKIFQERVNGTCRDCNTQWMSSLETQVQPYASPLILGRGKELDAEGQFALAAWAITKMMAIQTIVPKRGLIPRDHMREMYGVQDDRFLPEGMQVFTAGLADREPTGYYHQYRLFRDPGETSGAVGQEAYLVTFTILHLVVQVFRPLVGLAPDTKVDHPHTIRDAVRRIWPTSDSFEWPPRPLLTSRGLEIASGEGVR